MKSSIGAFKLSNGIIVPFTHIESEQFKIYKQEASSNINNELLNKYNIDAYYCDNEIICDSNNAYMKFKSLQDLINVIEDFELNQGKLIEPLSGLNNYNESFPLFTRTIIDNYLNKLGLNKSIDIIEIIKKSDEYINNNENDFVLWSNFIAFIAIIGEATIKAGNSVVWKMKLSSDGETWNPELSDGITKCDVVFIVYKYIFENQSNNKLIDCLTMTLSRFKNHK